MTTAASQFEISTLVFGALLLAGALLAGLAHRSFLSMTAVFVVAGFVLGDGVLGVLEFDAESGFVEQLATVALIVILFRDGLEAEGEMLQREWRLPARKLVLAMPITCAVVAVVAHALTDLSWTESFLLGALLSPTDPVLSSSVVTNPRVPRLVRHSLNLESGLNDGLALPAVLAFSAALATSQGDFGAVRVRSPGRRARLRVRRRDRPCRVVRDAAGGAVLVRPRRGVRDLRGDRAGADRQRLHRGVRVRDHARRPAPRPRPRLQQHAGDIVEIVKLGIFVVFGALLTFDGLFMDGWAAVAIVAFTLLLARPIAIWIALAGTRTDTATKAFMAWFGPKGVATMTFSILVLGLSLENGERIFDLAALAVFCSIVLHGLTDTPGVEWLARRSPEEEES